MRSRLMRAVGLLFGTAAIMGIALVVHSNVVEAKSKTIGSINYIKGTAKRYRGTSKTPTNIKKGLALYAGDKLKTEKGARLEARLSDGSMLRLGSSSELRLENISFDKKKKRKVKAKLVVGRVWAAVRSWFGSDDNFEVETRSAVAGVRGTRFSASQSADGTAQVKVYSGKVLVSNEPVYKVKGATKETRKEVAGPVEISKEQWTEMVAGAMQLVTVAANGDLGQPSDFQLAAAGDDADWEKWNREMDDASGFKDGK